MPPRKKMDLSIPGMPAAPSAPPARAPAAAAAGVGEGEPVNPYSGQRVPLQHRVYVEQHARIADIAEKLTARGWRNASAAEVTQMLVHPAMTESDEEIEQRWRDWMLVQIAPPAPRNGSTS